MSDYLNSIRIVIPTFNRVNDLVECIQSLKAAGIKDNQIIVVDNCSQDDTEDKIRQLFPNINLITLENNLGAAIASNIGFDYILDHISEAEYVLRLDSDTIVAPDIFKQLYKGSANSKNIGVFGPKIYYHENPKQIWYAGAEANPWHFGAVNTHIKELDSPSNSQIRIVDYIWGAAMMIKREVLQKTRGFDPDFFIYHEEIDFCRRVQGLGFKLLFIPEAHVWHKVGSTNNNAFTAYYWNRSKILLYRKHANNKFHLFFLILYVFFYMVFDALFFQLKLKKSLGNRGPILHALRGFYDGLRHPISSQKRIL
jgi:GT2 family glycosyltransferase